MKSNWHAVLSCFATLILRRIKIRKMRHEKRHHVKAFNALKKIPVLVKSGVLVSTEETAYTCHLSERVFTAFANPIPLRAAAGGLLCPCAKSGIDQQVGVPPYN